MLKVLLSMSSKSVIHKLDEVQICRIAAGEVVEGVSSVIKELLDNAIDAKASKIIVELIEGGRQLIRVSDNGIGMCPEDARLCLERHATSKVRSLEDIYSCQTHGFRGEAIPSIASVSKFSILTASSLTSATSIQVEGGLIIHEGESSREIGTTIEVKKLFYNVPVRRKFQKAPSYDLKQCIKVMQSHAIAHPHCHFICKHNNKEVLNLSSNQHLNPVQQQEERIENIYGNSWMNKHTYIDTTEGELHLRGWFAKPEHHAATRAKQIIFINNRIVFNPFISQTISNMFSHAIPAGRHPQFLILLTLDPGFVDPNVHPQKKEVRLRRQELLSQWIQKALSSKLQLNTWADLLDPAIQNQVSNQSLEHLKPASDKLHIENLSIKPRSLENSHIPKFQGSIPSSTSVNKTIDYSPKKQTYFNDSFSLNIDYSSNNAHKKPWKVLELVDNVLITLWKEGNQSILRLFNMNLMQPSSRNSEKIYVPNKLLNPIIMDIPKDTVHAIQEHLSIFNQWGVNAIINIDNQLVISALHPEISSSLLQKQIDSLCDTLISLSDDENSLVSQIILLHLQKLHKKVNTIVNLSIEAAELLLEHWYKKMMDDCHFDNKPYVDYNLHNISQI